jgi:chloramphenicol-sensitive protein RarD
MMAGLVTATPLILFAVAAKRLKLSTLGFFQYITPTGQFLLAVFLYNEPFTDVHKITFGMIWLALTIYSFDSFTAHMRK